MNLDLKKEIEDNNKQIQDMEQQMGKFGSSSPDATE
jgi:hypothetical protein